MADFTVKKIDEMETTFGGGLRKARAELAAVYELCINMYSVNAFLL